MPVNVDPEDPMMEDAEARARMVRTFDRGLSQPTGFVLPIQPWNALAAPRWIGERWALRRGKLFLLPGDSPVGHRLPMNSLPWTPPPPPPPPPRLFIPISIRAICSSEARPAAGSRRIGISSYSVGAAIGRQNVFRSDCERGRIAGHALRIEPRDGVLRVFMPPVESLDDYLEP